MRLSQLAVILAVCGAFLAPPATALAYEDAMTLELSGGYALAVGDGVPRDGLSGSVLVSYGINDVFTLRASITDTFHPRSTNLLLAGVDLLYVVDVLRTVPYVGLGVDGGVLQANGNTDGIVGGHLALGVDYLIDRGVFVGLEVRPTWLLREANLLDVPITVKIGFPFPL